MILIDTSVWIGHLHRSDQDLVDLLGRAAVAQHPMVVGELALGSLLDRELFLDLLQNLPSMPVATYAEVLHFVDRKHLYGQGQSLVDPHLLAAVILAVSLDAHAARGNRSPLNTNPATPPPCNLFT